MSTEPTVTVVIGMGHHVDGRPRANPADTIDAHAAVIEATRACGATLDAHVFGDAWSAWGNEPATWISATIPTANLPALRAHLAALAVEWQQDALALTVGQTEFPSS